MKYKYLLPAIAAIFSGSFSFAQTPFVTTEYLDINNVKAAARVHGDIWSTDSTGNSDSLAECEFPIGSGKNVMSSGALWMAGYDAGHLLHAAAQTYRQDGNDYWPGPLDNNDTCTYASSQNWAKIWKVNYSDIQTFLSMSNHTTSNTPTVILQWPAKGNPYAAGNNNAPLTITEDMAPFVDVNNDGIYNPLDGDYPLMKGDQMLWWVYNDNGATFHSQTQTLPLYVEIHAMAYAYRRYTLIDNVIYYQYDIQNKSQNTYDSFRIAQFMDPDIGTPWDDNVGYDSVYRMGIAYNDTSFDAVYGMDIPVAGVTLIHLPGDTANYIQSIGSFMFYYNDFTVQGNPSDGTQFNYYMRSEITDGDTINITPYMQYPFAFCDSSIYHVGDKRIVMSTQDMTFLPGETKTIVTALVVTPPDTGNTCPDISITGINTVADTAWAVYNNPPGPDAVTNPQAPSATINIYPNPVSDVLNVAYSGLTNAQIIITDITGRTLVTKNLPNQNGSQQINMQGFSPGMYLYRVTDNGIIKKQGKFVKE